MLHQFDNVDYSKFSKSGATVTTRNNAMHIKIKHCNTKIATIIFSNVVISQYNKLPAKVVSATSIEALKNRSNKYFAKMGVIFTVHLTVEKKKNTCIPTY